MVKRAILLTLAAIQLTAQNPVSPVFPSAVITDQDYPLPSLFTQTTLSSGINASTLTLPVADSTTGFRFPTIVVIGAESILVCSQTGGTQLNVCTGGRGLLSTAASHLSGANVGVRVVDYYNLRTQAEIKAIQTALGVNLANLVAACTSATELTIASGAVTVPASGCYLVDTESDAASDDLTAINCATGVQFIFRPADGARTVRIVDDDAAIFAQASFFLDAIGDSFQGVCTATNTVTEVSRSNAQ